MIPEKFATDPRLIEHLSQCAEPLDEMLVNHLIETCATARGGEHAQSDNGAAKAIANLIKNLRGIYKPRRTPEKKITMKKLNRFGIGNNQQPEQQNIKQ